MMGVRRCGGVVEVVKWVLYGGICEVKWVLVSGEVMVVYGGVNGFWLAVVWRWRYMGW